MSVKNTKFSQNYNLYSISIIAHLSKLPMTAIGATDRPRRFNIIKIKIPLRF